MTQDEMIEMVRWSGLGMLLEVGGMDKCLEHFAKLVAEKEREACAKECDNADYLGIAAHHCANAIRARTKA